MKTRWISALPWVFADDFFGSEKFLVFPVTEILSIFRGIFGQQMLIFMKHFPQRSRKLVILLSLLITCEHGV